MKKIITQKELSEKLGITRPFVCCILDGRRRPSAKTAARLEKITGVGRMTWLYGDKRQLVKDLEMALGGKINFKRGRPVKEATK